MEIKRAQRACVLECGGMTPLLPGRMVAWWGEHGTRHYSRAALLERPANWPCSFKKRCSPTAVPSPLPSWEGRGSGPARHSLGEGG